MDVIGYDLAITTAADVTLAGRVLAADGTALRNAKVLMFDAEGNTYAALSNAFGYYSFADIPSGKTYTVTVAAKGFAFQPRIVSLDDDLTGFDLVASP